MGTLIIVFVIGGISGVFVYGALNYHGSKILGKRIHASLISAFDEGTKYGAIKHKLVRIREISKEQTNSLSSLETPNASAAHARYKNTLVADMKRLEEEKKSLFKSIISEGVDPVLSVSIDGQVKDMKTSELLAYMENTSEQPTVPHKTKTDSINPRRNRLLKLIANNEDKNDVRTNPSDSTVY